MGYGKYIITQDPELNDVLMITHNNVGSPDDILESIQSALDTNDANILTTSFTISLKPKFATPPDANTTIRYIAKRIAG